MVIGAATLHLDNGDTDMLEAFKFFIVFLTVFCWIMSANSIRLGENNTAAITGFAVTAFLTAVCVTIFH